MPLRESSRGFGRATAGLIRSRFLRSGSRPPDIGGDGGRPPGISVPVAAADLAPAAAADQLVGDVAAAGDDRHEQQRAEETEELAASLAGNDGVYFVPALTGLGSPHWDPHARGTIVGLTRGSSRAHLARATLEAIAYQTVDAVRAMEAVAGQPLGELRADGGASANGWLMQFQADVLGVPVVVAPSAETTALGAACLAGVGVGAWTVSDILARARDEEPGRRYEPRMDAEERAALLAGWSDALSRARGGRYEAGPA